MACARRGICALLLLGVLPISKMEVVFEMQLRGRLAARLACLGATRVHEPRILIALSRLCPPFALLVFVDTAQKDPVRLVSHLRRGRRPLGDGGSANVAWGTRRHVHRRAWPCHMLRWGVEHIPRRCCACGLRLRTTLAGCACGLRAHRRESSLSDGVARRWDLVRRAAIPREVEVAERGVE